MQSAATWILRIVAVFYAYGAFVHLANMAGLSGFDWRTAPLKWQILDVFYLATDVTVAIGIFRGWKAAIPTFYVAAITQVILYTFFRDWITDVPASHAIAPEQKAYLSTLVAFHGATLALVSAALLALRHRGDRRAAD